MNSNIGMRMTSNSLFASSLIPLTRAFTDHNAVTKKLHTIATTHSGFFSTSKQSSQWTNMDQAILNNDLAAVEKNLQKPDSVDSQYPPALAAFVYSEKESSIEILAKLKSTERYDFSYEMFIDQESPAKLRSAHHFLWKKVSEAISKKREVEEEVQRLSDFYHYPKEEEKLKKALQDLEYWKTMLKYREFVHRLFAEKIPSEENKILGERIISSFQGRAAQTAVAEIVRTEKFEKDPTTHLITLMVERGVGRLREDDPYRAFVISKIPNFVDQVGSQEYLRSFAFTYFKDHPVKDRVMSYFNQSLEKEIFKKNLKEAIGHLRSAMERGNGFLDAENQLRVPLTIFKQAEDLQHYKFPDKAYLE